MDTVLFPGMSAGENAAGDIPRKEWKEETVNFSPVYSKKEQKCHGGKCKQQLHHPEAVRAPTGKEMKLQKEQGEKMEQFEWFSAENAWMSITPIPHQA